MLVLTRRTNEAVQIGDIVVRVLSVSAGAIRLGFEAPEGVNILRQELVTDQGDHADDGEL